MAKIHTQLVQDCFYLGRFKLCHLLMMNDTNYPWFILVPDRDEVSEIYQLNEADQQLLQQESSYLSQQLASHFNADKMNIAALGNVVPQLHIHHIVRFGHDRCWPKPVWGQHEAAAYDQSELDRMNAILSAAIKHIEWQDDWYVLPSR